MISHGGMELKSMVIHVKDANVTTMQHLVTMIKKWILILKAMTQAVVEYATVLTTQLDRTVILVYNFSIGLLAVIHLQQMHAFLVTAIQMASGIMETV